ncbi:MULTISPECIES: glycerophosphodiester phosphodiesterase family protein [Rhizobium]|uniref:glycerophosphodiester phosphodiesterase family protein n=1 Tax=Rhizobium TaxID=379 RepID=UPI001F15FB0B|nr:MULTISPECIES: glycerophosphodiester phosphodiesterase family protein [Rhizobium]WEO69912.1 glycerophosphodiester phosphodiesterase family protein [Rhizobium rhizogenes]
MDGSSSSITADVAMPHLCQRKPSSLKEKGWPEWKLQWDLPPGVTSEDVLERHSVANLLQRLHEPLPLQVIEHRGMYNLGKGVQECTETSILTALGEGNRNLCELDVALTRDNMPIVSHEFNLWRVTTLPDKPIREMPYREIENVPVIIREISEGRISDSYVVTNDFVPFLEPLLDNVFKVNPVATVFLDGRQFEAHIITAWLSHRPRYHQRVVLLFYTFKYSDGDSFVDAVKGADPAPDWRQTIALMPAIFPHELPRLAKLLHLDDLAVEDLYAAGRAWIDSILKQTMRIVAVHIVFAGVKSDQLGQCTNPEVIRAFNEDHAAVRLAYYVKEDPDVRKMHPCLKLMAVTRSYDFSDQLEHGGRAEYGIDFMTGRAVKRETDERKHIRRGYGTPGNAAAMADWVISDRPEDDMAVWEWRKRDIHRNVDHRCPHLDVIGFKKFE